MKDLMISEVVAQLNPRSTPAPAAVREKSLPEKLEALKGFYVEEDAYMEVAGAEP